MNYITYKLISCFSHSLLNLRNHTPRSKTRIAKCTMEPQQSASFATTSISSAGPNPLAYARANCSDGRTAAMAQRQPNQTPSERHSYTQPHSTMPTIPDAYGNNETDRSFSPYHQTHYHPQQQQHHHQHHHQTQHYYRQPQPKHQQQHQRKCDSDYGFDDDDDDADDDDDDAADDVKFMRHLTQTHQPSTNYQRSHVQLAAAAAAAAAAAPTHSPSAITTPTSQQPFPNFPPPPGYPPPASTSAQHHHHHHHQRDKSSASGIDFHPSNSATGQYQLKLQQQLNMEREHNQYQPSGSTTATAADFNVTINNNYHHGYQPAAVQPKPNRRLQHQQHVDAIHIDTGNETAAAAASRHRRANVAANAAWQTLGRGWSDQSGATTGAAAQMAVAMNGGKCATSGRSRGRKLAGHGGVVVGNQFGSLDPQQMQQLQQQVDDSMNVRLSLSLIRLDDDCKFVCNIIVCRT